MPTLHPHLMFEGKAEEAINLYVSLFADGEVLVMQKAESGTVQYGMIRIAGQKVALLDSPVHHEFGFTPAASLFVTCDDEAQLDALYAALSEGGKALMPLGSYGFSRKFGWVDDRFGVSWQLNLP